MKAKIEEVVLENGYILRLFIRHNEVEVMGVPGPRMGMCGVAVLPRSGNVLILRPEPLR